MTIINIICRFFNCWGLNLLGFKTFGLLCCLWIRPSLSSQISWLTQEDHLCRHQHITSKTSSVLDLHTEQSYMRNQRTIQLTKFRWKLSSSWLRCIFILAQTHQSGQEIRNKRIHCSLCRFFPTKISTE